MTIVSGFADGYFQNTKRGPRNVRWDKSWEAYPCLYTHAGLRGCPNVSGGFAVIAVVYEKGTKNARTRNLVYYLRLGVPPDDFNVIAEV